LGQSLEDNLLEKLVEKAKVKTNRKACFCLHPTPGEILQITYFAFLRPHSEKIHEHSHHPKLVVPILSEARYATYEFGGRSWD